jgi:hypothetical protein
MHRVERVLQAFSSELRHPTSSPAGECVPPLGPWGTHSLVGEERGWVGPNSDEGTDTVVL